jgi:rhodanese-related sulfurtransferase
MVRRFKITHLIMILASFLLLTILSSCSSKTDLEIKETPVADTAQKFTETKKISFTNINPQEAKKRLENEKEIILLDVRTKEEYKSGHIEDSILIPVDDLEANAENTLKDKSAPVFVYCRSGNRSVSAANILLKLGYTNVYNLGGIRDWPYDIVK